MSLEDLNRYQYGGLAARVYKESPGLAIGALEKFAKEIGIDETAEGFIKAALSTEEGIKTTSEVYGGKYIKNGFEPTKISDLFTHYSDGIFKLSDYLNADKIGKIKEKFDEYGEKTYKEIDFELKKANYILQGEEFGFLEDQRERAKETIKNYKNVMTFIKAFEEVKFEKLRGNASEEYNKKILEKLVEEVFSQAA